VGPRIGAAGARHPSFRRGRPRPGCAERGRVLCQMRSLSSYTRRSVMGLPLSKGSECHLVRSPRSPAAESARREGLAQWRSSVPSMTAPSPPESERVQPRRVVGAYREVVLTCLSPETLLSSQPWRADRVVRALRRALRDRSGDLGSSSLSTAATWRKAEKDYRERPSARASEPVAFTWWQFRWLSAE
jgi:hypothetical protein